MSLVPSGGYHANEALQNARDARQEVQDQKSVVEALKVEVASAKNEIMILRVEIQKCMRFQEENTSLKEEVAKLKKAFLDTLDVFQMLRQ